MALRPILADTDIGSDLDDLWALLLALASPEVWLAGVTTVHGDARLRAAITRRVLDLAGRPDVPIAVGRDAPLCGGPPGRLLGHEGDGILCPGAIAGDFHPLPAPEFIVDAAHRYAGELTIVAIGPLTNLAAAIEMDRTIVSRLRQIVLMGGGYYERWRNRREHNFHCDPPAANVVLRCGAPIRMVGYNVTDRCKFRLTELLDLASSAGPLAEAVRVHTSAFFKHLREGRYASKPKWLERPSTNLHDPLAVAVAINPGLVRLQPRAILVSPTGKTIVPAAARPTERVLDASGVAVRLRDLSGPASTIEMATKVSVRELKRWMNPRLQALLR